jgi:hypothetical protein
MPLDTRLPLLAGQFKPITYQAPSQANMLAEVAQAASAMQGLQRNAMAMRQEREKEQRVGSLSQMLSQLAASGETPTSLREMGQALVSSRMPEFMTKGMTLIQRAGELEQALRQQETDEAEMARILGGAAPAGVGAPVAPATAAAQPSAVPAAMPSPMPAAAGGPQAPRDMVALQSIFEARAPAQSAATLAQGPGQSDMIAGGARGTAQVNAMLGASAPSAPIINQMLTQQPGAEMTPELADAMLAGGRSAAANAMPPANVPGGTRLQSLFPTGAARPPQFSMREAQEYVTTFPALIRDLQLQIPRVRSDAERAKLQSYLKEAQETLVEAQRIVRGIPAATPAAPRTAPPAVPVAGAAPAAATAALPPEPAPAAAPQTELAPVVAPRAAAPAEVQVAGPMVAGAAPAAGEDEISALEARRERVRTSRLSATRKKDEIAEIDRKLGILREQNKPTELLRNYQAALAQGYRGTIEDFRKSGAQQINVETKVNAFVPASEQAQKDYIGNIAEERKALRNAPDTLANISEARKLIPSAATFMGTGGEPLLAAASFLNNRLGFGIKTEGVRDATVLRTRLFESILENLKKLDSQPSQEQQRVMQQALGSLGTDPNALPLVFDKMEEAVRSRVDRYNVDVTEAEKRGVKFPFRPQINLPSRFSAQDQQALDWANANPSDSRAAQIKQRLGVK